MPKFRVVIHEITERTYEVRTKDIDSAKDAAYQRYMNGEDGEAHVIGHEFHDVEEVGRDDDEI